MKKNSAYQPEALGKKPETIKHSRLRSRLFPLVMTLLAFNTAWWYYSAINNLDIGQLFAKNNSTWLLLLYTVIIALTFFASFNRANNKYAAFLLALLSGILIIFLSSRLDNHLDNHIAELLLLISAFLFLMQIQVLNLKSVYGMLAFSFMAGTAIPTAIFCLQNSHVDRSFLYSLIPLCMTFAFFLTPIFMPRGLSKSVISMLIGLALIVDTLVTAINVWFFLNTAILIITWAIFINLKLKAKYQLSIYLMMMFLSVLLLTAQMSS